jgi:hypothetical protein
MAGLTMADIALITRNGIQYKALKIGRFIHGFLLRPYLLIVKRP